MTIFDNLKQGKLGTVETAITFDKSGVINLVTGLAVATVIIILVINILKKV